MTQNTINKQAHEAILERMGATEELTNQEVIEKLKALYDAALNFVSGKASNGGTHGIVKAEFAIYEAMKGLSKKRVSEVLHEKSN